MDNLKVGTAGMRSVAKSKSHSRAPEVACQSFKHRIENVECEKELGLAVWGTTLRHFDTVNRTFNQMTTPVFAFSFL